MTSPIRVGIGYDIHRLVPDRPLVLAGVEIPHSRGALAHSDGDVVLHAVADAILGAVSLGDLGEHFPDSDPQWAGVASRTILERVVEMARDAGWTPASADVNVLLERPKLRAHRDAMRQRLAQLLGVPSDAVGMKARTHEGLGPVGEGLAVAAQAVVVLESICGKNPA
jgi:2-C-methyl-D-erythritol 2,4-cyclodiphosphate synthase